MTRCPECTCGTCDGKGHCPDHCRRALPILVECPPLEGKLTREACVRRYEIANGAAPRGHRRGYGRPEDTADALAERLRASACRGCATGAARKAESDGG